MLKIRTKMKQYSLGIVVNNHKRNLICRAPTKIQLLLYELVSQIPLFLELRRLPSCLLKKTRTTKDYSKIKENL